MSYDPGVLRTPVHAHAVKTPAEYRRFHEAHLAFLRSTGRQVVSWEADRGAMPVISGGTWKVMCACGNAPVASPEWDEARCLDCGAIYRGLRWPANHEAIGDALLVRPRTGRHWRPGTTVSELTAENLRRGLRAKKERR